MSDTHKVQLYIDGGSRGNPGPAACGWLIKSLDGETLVFVEVRSKRGTAYGSPAESITPTKQRKLRLTVETYLSQLEKLPPDWRIDAVLVSGYGASKNVEQIKDAVGG